MKLSEEIKKHRARAAALESLVEKLPLTDDGVRVVPGRDTIYWEEMASGEMQFIDGEWWWSYHAGRRVSDCYSTRAACQAAQAARDAKGGGNS